MERPIIFSGPMVRAILEGRKTQTRRPVQVLCHGTDGKTYKRPWPTAFPETRLDRCPYGKPGDRLWVRETFCETMIGDAQPFAYRATDILDSEMFDGGIRWRPSIHMPRWASRLTLEVVSVRVERVQDITDADSRAEGVVCSDCASASPRWGHCCCRLLFRVLWSQNYEAKGYGWDANPWVWVVEFRVVEARKGAE